MQQKSSKVISSQDVGAMGKELASVDDDDEYEEDFSEPPSGRVTKGKAQAAASKPAAKDNDEDDDYSDDF